MDRISQERILEQIDKENFNSMKYLKEEYFEFKKMNQGNIPLFLMDYMKFDGAPDPIKFIDREKTYLQFVAKVEKNEQLKNLLLDPAFEGALNELSSKLPLKRIYEFVIARYLLEHEEISLETANQEMLKFIKHVNEDSVKHAFECLNQDYYDTAQLKRKIKLFTIKMKSCLKPQFFKKCLQ